MSIFKDTFRDYVRRQLILREELIDIGNTTDNVRGERTNRLKSFPVKSPPNANFPYEFDIKPGAFYSYTTNRQCVIRLTSLVDYVADVGLDIGDLGSQSFNRLKGPTLSRNFILQGGVLSDFSRTVDRGEDGLQSKTRKIDQVRQGFEKPGLKTNLAYGDFAIGSDASEDGYGIVPMPGIIDANIRTKSAYGSLREAKINFECHNRRQLEILEMLYMRPGYMVLLEWGWCPYIKSSGNKEEKGSIETNLRLLEDISGGRIYTNDITQQEVFNLINKLKESQDGNYDAMLGFVKNFGFQARDDGGFSCFTELISIGEVIESLKIPAVSFLTPSDVLGGTFITDDGGVDTTGIGVEGGEYDVVKDQEGRKYYSNESYGAFSPLSSTYHTGGDIVIYGGKAYGAQSSAVLGDSKTKEYGKPAGTMKARDATIIDRSEFDQSIQMGIFPRYNGLLGLMKTIYNYSSITVLDSHGYERILKENFGNEFVEHIGTDFEDVDNEKTENLDYKKRQELKQKQTSAKQLFKVEGELDNRSKTDTTMNIRIKSMKVGLKNLVKFQSADFEVTLMRLLGMTNPSDLRHYFIKRRRPPQYTGYTGDYNGEGVKAHFIRWDALCVLINSYLIPKIEKGTTPVQLITDRIYDTGYEEARIDPLLFAPIADSNQDESGNSMLFDFSSDPEVCILPLQFSLGPNSRASGDADPLYVKSAIGYEPLMEVFPIDYIRGTFDKDKTLTYEGVAVVNEPNAIVLNDTDKLRRIGSIFINVDMLLNLAKKNSDDEEYTLGQFINDIWKEINKVCPNHNFVLTDDKESKSIFIIDLPVDNSKAPKREDLHEFIPFSNKNILRNFEYTSNIPSALSSTIAIQAQDPRSIQDIDGVTFSAFNRAIKNRLLSNDITPSYTKMKNDIQSNRSSFQQQQSKLQKALYSFRSNFFRNLESIGSNETKIGAGNPTGTLKTYQKNAAYITQTRSDSLTFSSVIPLEFSATLDGISGIVIGNMFKVQKDRLPKAYERANIGFIVFNEEQKITAGGDWTTDISGKMTLLPTNTVHITGISTNVKNAADSGEENVTTNPVVVSDDGSSTEDLAEGQDLITRIDEVPPGGDIFLKYTKNPDISTIGGEDVSQESHGYSVLRVGPRVDNESGLLSDSYDDNAVGMFDSYNNAGLYLGVLKTATAEGGSELILNAPNSDYNGRYDTDTGHYSQFYGDDKQAFKPEFISEYIQNPRLDYRYTINPTDFIRKDEGQGMRLFPKGTIKIAEGKPEQRDLTATAINDGILETHLTKVKAIWMCIKFDPSVDDLFNQGWVYNASDPQAITIDKNGADYALASVGGFKGKEYMRTHQKLSDYSNNFDCWMRFDTLAAGEDDALQLLIKKYEDGEVDSIPNSEVLQRVLNNMDVE